MLQSSKNTIFSSSDIPAKKEPSNLAGRRGLRDITNAARNESAADLPTKKNTSKSNVMKTQTLANLESIKRPESAEGCQRTQKSKDVIRQLTDADDIDARDSNDPRMVTHYVSDIYSHLREKEMDCVKPTYLDQQPFINAKMRAILIDWLIEVHQKFRCVPETLYLTVSVLDRYLERKGCVKRSILQLVGVTALLIAAKYEEIYPPEIRQLVHVTDKAYKSKEILEMEVDILNTLDFKVTFASTHNFLVRYLKAAHADRMMVWMACFIAERILLEESMLQFFPSMVASCAVYLARKNLQRNPWSPTLLKYTDYTEQDLLPCLKVMTEILISNSSLTAAKTKYSNQKFGAVALRVIEGVRN